MFLTLKEQYTVERRLSGLLRTKPRPDMRITRIMSQMIYFLPITD